MGGSVLTKKMTITHEGWLLFCPIWVGDFEATMNVFPKFRLGLLLDVAVMMQVFFGWILSYFHYEPCFVMSLRELEHSRQFEMEIDDGQNDLRDNQGDPEQGTV